MKRQFVKINGVEYPRIHNEVLIGDWQEVSTFEEAKTIIPELAPQEINGLVLKGYEMKWNTTNENLERYEQTAFDDFINSYFIENKLDMPVDINHEGYSNWQAYCGRVLYLERNSVGFYFVVYVPKDYPEYDRLVWCLRNHIIQGFSKEGYATDWDFIKDDEGRFQYELIKSMKLLSVSLVGTPANGIPFEKMQEVKNGLQYVVKDTTEKEEKETLKREDF